MILGYKNRRPRPGQRYRVYRKISGSGIEVWSIRATTGRFAGRVVGHADELVLRDVTFWVSEAGRARVLREGRKNVHAYAIGRLGQDGDTMTFPDTGVHYNPYAGGSFTDDTGEAIEQAKKAQFTADGKVWAN